VYLEKVETSNLERGSTKFCYFSVHCELQCLLQWVVQNESSSIISMGQAGEWDIFVDLWMLLCIGPYVINPLSAC
jgi:hypothetical protein